MNNRKAVGGWSVAVVLLAMGLLLVACTSASTGQANTDQANSGQANTAQANTGQASEPPLIVVTTGIWTDVVKNVACVAGQTGALDQTGAAGSAQVVSLIPDGGDPHVFEPSLADRALLDRASLVVANGLDLEAGLADTLEAVEQAGTPVFRIGDHIDPISVSLPRDRAGLSDHDHRTDDSHEIDPHIWFDPSRVAQALPALAQGLIDQAGLVAADVNACLEQYRSQLISLDAHLADLFGQIPPEHRKLITNHDSIGYLADRYNLQVIGTISPAASTIAASSPAQLAELVELIAADDVAAIFTETQRSDDDARAIASRAGVVQLVPLFTETLGPPGSGAETYIGLLTTDAERITNALS